MALLLLARLGLALFAVFLFFNFKTLAELLRSAWVLRKLPCPPAPSLIAGHVKLLTNPTGSRRLSEWAHKFSGIFRLRTFWKQIVIIADPVLLADLHELERAGAIDKPDVPLAGSRTVDRHLFSEKSTHPWWKLVRKGVAPAFNPANLRFFHHHVVYVVDCLISSIKEQGPDAIINMADVAQRESFDVIGNVGFGTDFNTRKDITREARPGFAPDYDVFAVFKEALTQAVAMASNPLLAYVRHLKFIPAVRRAERAAVPLKEMSSGLLKTVQLRGPPAADDRSVAAHLMRLRDPVTKLPLPDSRLIQEFLVFFVAGAETTGHTISWTMYELVKNPRVMAKLEAELDAAGLLVSPERPQPRRFAFSDIQLPYLQAVVKESMRLHPVALNGYRRIVVRDCQLSNGVLLPKGAIVSGLNIASLSDPRYWGPDALEFVSERWEDAALEFVERKASGSQSSAQRQGEDEDDYDLDISGGHGRVRRFHPFGDGMRSCIGQSLARMNVPTAVAMLVCAFRFKMDKSIEDAGTFDLECARATLQQEHGLPLYCIPREAALA
eukprot:jgi/Botrbrau1/6747/Bobra.0324s0032.1